MDSEQMSHQIVHRRASSCAILCERLDCAVRCLSEGAAGAERPRGRFDLPRRGEGPLEGEPERRAGDAMAGGSHFSVNRIAQNLKHVHLPGFFLTLFGLMKNLVRHGFLSWSPNPQR